MRGWSSPGRGNGVYSLLRHSPVAPVLRGEGGVMQSRPEATTAKGPRAPEPRTPAAEKPPSERGEDRKRGKSGKKRKAAKLARLHKPEGMSLEDWQVDLRRQFGREQSFRL